MQMNPRKGKQVVLPANPVTSKTPHYLGHTNIEDRHLTWRFSSADISGPYSCNAFGLNDFKKLWERLRAFEKMNAAALKNDGSYHRIPTPNLSNEAKERLKLMALDDMDILYSFRITATRRLLCMKHENIFSILWWDKDHKAYPVEKKNT